MNDDVATRGLRFDFRKLRPIGAQVAEEGPTLSPVEIMRAINEVGRSVITSASPSMIDDCYSCADPTIPGATDASPRDECPSSKRPCGHHCNCSWIHDVCHWCGEEFGEE